MLATAACAINPVLRAASAVVTPVMKPIASQFAPLQAGSYDEKAVLAEIKKETKNSVVVYTYDLSPFCIEAVSFLESLGVKPTVISLGAEWVPGFINRADKRNELLKMTGQSSLPHVFVGGTSLGGLFSGTPGLVPAYEDGSLLPLLKKARAI